MRHPLKFLGWVGVPLLVATACGAAAITGSLSAPGSHSAHASAAPSSTPPESAASESSAAGAAVQAGVQAVVASESPTADGGRLITSGLPGGAYTPSAPSGGTDDYHCFLINPQITTDTFLTGVAFLPGNPAVVHHAILFRVPADSVDAVKAKDAETDTDGWNCFGDSGVPRGEGDQVESLGNAPWLAAWAPGGGETRYRKGTGVQMSAGTQVILQMHYNLLAGSGPDASGVRLRFAPPGAELTPLHTMLLPAPVELPCAPGQTGRLCDRDNAILDVAARFGKGAFARVGGLQLLCGGDPLAPRSGATTSCDRFISEPITVVAAAGHMHMLGRAIRIDKVAADGSVTNLLNTQVWNFDDQSATVLPEPVNLVRGDHVRVTCTHDATLRDKIPSLASQPDRYVVWGEGTSDEMCLGILTTLGDRKSA